MTLRLLSVAPLALAAPLLLAQQTPAPQPPQQQPPQQHGRMHNGQRNGMRGNGAPDQRMSDNRAQMRDERMDLDELGLPAGQFWLDPEVVSAAGLTPDQVRRLADAHLQGTLKLIQLEADLQMDQARLDPMLSAVPMDSNATLAQLDRIADANAAIDKADARIAFALRAVLSADQLARLHTATPFRMPPQGQPGNGTPQAPPQM